MAFCPLAAKGKKSRELLLGWTNLSPAHTTPSHWPFTCIHACYWTESKIRNVTRNFYLLCKCSLTTWTLRWVPEFSMIFETGILSSNEQTVDVIFHVFLSTACSHADFSGQNADPPHQFRSSYYRGEGTDSIQNGQLCLPWMHAYKPQTILKLATFSRVYRERERERKVKSHRLDSRL